MRTARLMSLGAVGVAFTVLIAAGRAPSDSAAGDDTFTGTLRGFEEVPAISSTGMGDVLLTIGDDESFIDYELRYDGLEATAVQAHIHLGQRGVNGGVMAFLCGGGGKPPCPPSGTVTGTITAADVIGPSGQGIAPGELQEVLRALRDEVVYANVHTTKHPGGEIRGQVCHTAEPAPCPPGTPRGRGGQ